MSSAINITVNDGQSTPVAHTFYPVQNTDGKGFTFYDSLVGIPAFETKIWAKLAMGSPVNPTHSSLGVIQPIVKTVDGIIQQDHVNTYRGEFVFAPNASAAERADLYAYAINALNQALIREQTRDLKAMY